MTQRVRLDRNTIYDLPDDIVRHIIAKLCWSDRIRLSTVCKSLRSLVHGVQTIDEFPWIMSYGNWQSSINGKIYSYCRLADPSAQKCYVIEDSVKGKEGDDFIFAQPYASRNGWVLFQVWHQIFFYSPFTNEVIKLPNFDLDSTTRYLNATFSSSPTSPDCVVFVLSLDVEFGRCISTWSPCDKTWTHVSLGDLFGMSLDVTYVGGIFYVVFEDGKLGAYNAVLKDWKLFPNVLPINLKGATAYLVDSKEDKDPLLMCAFGGCWLLWRFDLPQTCWVEEQSIGNRTISLGCTSYSGPAVGRSSEFVDKIYGLQEVIGNNTKPRCASLEDCERWSQTELYSWMPKIRVEKSIWITST